MISAIFFIIIFHFFVIVSSKPIENCYNNGILIHFNAISNTQSVCNCSDQFYGAQCENIVIDKGVSFTKLPSLPNSPTKPIVRYSFTTLSSSLTNNFTLQWMFATHEKSGQLINLTLSNTNENIVYAAWNGKGIDVTFLINNFPYKYLVKCNKQRKWHEVSVSWKSISCDNNYSPTTNPDHDQRTESIDNQFIIHFAEHYFGCLKEIKLNGNAIDIQDLSKNINGIQQECLESCSTHKCYYHGQCLDKYDGQPTCDCFHSPYLGPQCYHVKSNYFDNEIVKFIPQKQMTFQGIKFMYAPFPLSQGLFSSDDTLYPFIIIQSVNGINISIAHQACEMVMLIEIKSQASVRYSYKLVDCNKLKQRYFTFRILLSPVVNAPYQTEIQRVYLDDDGNSLEEIEKIVINVPPIFIVREIQLGRSSLNLPPFQGCMQNVQIRLQGNNNEELNFDMLSNQQYFTDFSNLSTNTADVCFYSRTPIMELSSTLTPLATTTFNNDVVVVDPVETVANDSLIASQKSDQSSFVHRIGIFIALVVVVSIFIIMTVAMILFYRNRRTEKKKSSKNLPNDQSYDAIYQKEPIKFDYERTPFKPAYWAGSMRSPSSQYQPRFSNNQDSSDQPESSIDDTNSVTRYSIRPSYSNSINNNNNNNNSTSRTRGSLLRSAGSRLSQSSLRTSTSDGQPQFAPLAQLNGENNL